MADGQYYYIGDAGDPVGPLSWEVMQQLHAAGTVTPETMVARHGAGDWTPFGEFEPGRALPTVPTRSPVPGQQEQRQRIVRREFGPTFLFLCVSLSFYAFYLVPSYSAPISRLTGRQRLEFGLILVFGIITLGIFLAIYQCILAYDLEKYGKANATEGRQESLGASVVALVVVSYLVGLFSGGLGFILWVVICAVSVWLVQKEMNLYAES